MSKIDLDPITSGYNLSKINANFQKVEDELNNKVLYRDSPAGEPNSMSSNLDMNSQSILNANKISSNVLELGGVLVVPTGLATDPYNGTREALRRSYAEAGYNLVAGSFEAGGTVTSATDVLLYEATGIAYLWLGTLPKVVPAGSTPASTGGIDLGAWVSAADSYGEERLLGVGAKIYRGSNGQYVQNGDTVPIGTTHLAVLINGKVETVAMSPVASGAVSLLTETSATIGGNAVKFNNVGYKQFPYLYNSNGDIVVDNAVSLGDRISVDNYWENGNSGILFFRVVSASTGTHDGGKYIDLPFSNLQLEQNLKVPYEATAWGCRGDGASDNIVQSTNVINYAKLNPSSIHYQSGTYRHTGQLNPGDVHIFGDTTYRNPATKLVIDSATPVNFIINAQNLSNLEITSTQDKIHNGVLVAGYRVLWDNIRINRFDVGHKISGTSINVTNFYVELCNTGGQLHYGGALADQNSTVFKFSHGIYVYCTTGCIGKATYLDTSDDFTEKTPAGTNQSLIDVGFDDVIFEQNDIGLTSDVRIIDLLLINCWTEGNSTYGIDLLDSGSLVTAISTRKHPGDIWNVDLNKEFGGLTKFDGRKAYIPTITQYFRGDEVDQPITLVFEMSTSGGNTVEVGSKYVSLFNFDGGNQMIFHLNLLVYKPVVSITGLLAGKFLSSKMRVNNSIDGNSEITNIGSFNQMFIQFFDPSAPATIVKPDRISVHISFRTNTARES